MGYQLMYKESNLSFRKFIINNNLHYLCHSITYIPTLVSSERGISEGNSIVWITPSPVPVPRWLSEGVSGDATFTHVDTLFMYECVRYIMFLLHTCWEFSDSPEFVCSDHNSEDKGVADTRADQSYHLEIQREVDPAAPGHSRIEDRAELQEDLSHTSD